MSTRDAADAVGTGDVLADVERAIAHLQGHADPAVRDSAKALLEGIDAVHRSGLSHLMQALRAAAGDALINRLIADPAIRLLLMSYDLVPVDRRLQAEEALDAVRGHLHDHGIDAEIREVVGGVVSLRLHARSGPLDSARVAAARRDIEAALLEHFAGFQELVIGDPSPAAAVAHISVEALRRAGRPVYHDAIARDQLAEGGVAAVDLGGVPILLVGLAGTVYAIRNRCGDSPLPLQFGTLTGSELRCPWHGCRYDVRTGHRIDGEPGSVQVFPVSIADGRIRVALGVSHGEDAR